MTKRKNNSTHTNDDTTSINKFVSQTGLCSRREADRLIEQGRVLLNGKVAQKGNRVGIGDKVIVDGQKIKNNKRPTYIAFYKPKGIVCTTDTKEKNNIIDYLNFPTRIFPIGRLDKDSTGLILLTNDGDIVNKILRVENAHDKEYVVSVDSPINDRFINKMSSGVQILNTITKECKVSQLNQTTFKIILNQGLNRQIRRMCSQLGYKVKKLKRIRIMNITIDGLGIGQWRYLSPQELHHLLNEIR